MVGREDVDDPVDRLCCVIGVQGREDQMPGLGDGQGRRDGLQVAHLADLDDVGILAKRRPQRAGEIVRVGPDFALDDHRAVVTVHVLDRILDRDDVDGTSPIDLVEHGRHGRRLARPGRAGHEDEPVGPIDEVMADRWRPEHFQRWDDIWHEAQCTRERPALEEEVRANTGRIPEREAEIELPSCNELVPSRSGQCACERQCRIGGHRLLGQPDQDAVDSGRRSGTRREQQVGALAIGDDLQEHLDALIHGALQCTVCAVASGQVLVAARRSRGTRLVRRSAPPSPKDGIRRRSSWTLAPSRARTSSMTCVASFGITRWRRS